ncbi:hypothetical protein CPC08DRAFT_127378 [Agrocybe pediades]|nr:hypothetical protein CPC08DRAFT_127378 [Agrocybe pediades]
MSHSSQPPSSNESNHALSRDSSLNGTHVETAGPPGAMPPIHSTPGHPTLPPRWAESDQRREYRQHPRSEMVWPSSAPPDPRYYQGIPQHEMYMPNYNTRLPTVGGPRDMPDGPYQPAHPVGLGSRMPMSMIDPALTTPLPNDDESDPELPPADKILSSIAKPASKVAGSRRPALSAKAKGKQKEVVVDNPKRKRGRVVGTANYSEEDIDMLLDLLEDHLPPGAKAWNVVGEEFNSWASNNKRPLRTTKSLELKFKQLVRTSKPTGTADCPPHIERAHAIEDRIAEKVETRDLDDEDIVDDEDAIIEVMDSDVDEKEEEPRVKKAKSTAAVAASSKGPTKVKEEPKGPVARRPAADATTSSSRPRAHARTQASELISSISHALDPSLQLARDEERANRSLHSTQLLTISQSLRDAQRTIESLRSQLMQVQQARHDAERRADRAEMMAMLHGGRSPRFVDGRSGYSSPSSSRRRRQQSSMFSPRRPRPVWPSPRGTSAHRADSDAVTVTPPKLIRKETFFPEGGRHVQWLPVGGHRDDDDDLYCRSPTPEPGTITYTVSPCPTPSTSRVKHSDAGMAELDKESK